MFCWNLENCCGIPIIKKTGLDLKFKNFRLISNLQFVSKLTECVVASQIQCHMITNNLFPQLQSGVCIVKHNKWCTREYGQGPCITFTTAGFKCRLRHRWPGDFTTNASKETRCLWYCSFLVQIVLEREISKNMHEGDALAAVWLKMGCSSMFLSGTAFMYYLYTRCVL